MIATAVLTGCVSVQTLDHRGRIVTYNFGFTRVVEPPSYAQGTNIYAIGASLYGITLDQGITVGYKSKFMLQASMDCKVVFVVDNDSQLNRLLRDVPDIKKGEKICITVSPT